MKLVKEARESFNYGLTKPYEFRLAQLKGLLHLYNENMQDIMEALHKDLRKGKQETVVTEVGFVVNEVKNLISNLQTWMAPVNPGKGILNLLDNVKIFTEPYGVVLILGSWNYPIHVTLLPLAGAIAAGNCVIIKPSEIATASAILLSKLIPKYLNQV